MAKRKPSKRTKQSTCLGVVVMSETEYRKHVGQPDSWLACQGCGKKVKLILGYCAECEPDWHGRKPH